MHKYLRGYDKSIICFAVDNYKLIASVCIEKFWIRASTLFMEINSPRRANIEARHTSSMYRRFVQTSGFARPQEFSSSFAKSLANQLAYL